MKPWRACRMRRSAAAYAALRAHLAVAAWQQQEGAGRVDAQDARPSRRRQAPRVGLMVMIPALLTRTSTRSRRANSASTIAEVGDVSLHADRRRSPRRRRARWRSQVGEHERARLGGEACGDPLPIPPTGAGRRRRRSSKRTCAVSVVTCASDGRVPGGDRALRDHGVLLGIVRLARPIERFELARVQRPRRAREVARRRAPRAPPRASGRPARR